LETDCVNQDGDVLFHGQRTYTRTLPPPQSKQTMVLPRDMNLFGCSANLTVYCHNDIPCWTATQLIVDPQTNQMIGTKRYGELHFSPNFWGIDSIAGIQYPPNAVTWWFLLDWRLIQ
ncbi:MAG TPA: hypothetical protein VJC18_09560, partial [bacterium]|nr:hypothetical protein [bacterium]